MSNQIVFTVHCYVERKNDVWQAFSMEFGLAAQGESCPDAKARLDRMIRSYLEDALVGVDKPHQKQLLDRKAPFYQRAKYRFYWVLTRIVALKRRRVFKERVPLGPIPASC